MRESAECCIRCNSARFSLDCDGHSYQTITSFIADLFANGGDGILQFQDGTTALSSAQWTELDRALTKAPQPASSPASPPASPPAPASASTGGGAGTCAAAVPRAAGQATGAEQEPALPRAGHALFPETAGDQQ